MKVLVTGGAGFIGSHLVDALVGQGDQVAVVDNLSTGRMENLNPGVNFYKLDITSPEFLEVIARELPEVVFHLAAQVDVQRSLKDPLLDARVNILGTIHLLEGCRLNGVRKVIYSSSAAVYGCPLYLGVDEKHPVEPQSNYGISKHTPEHYLQAYGELYGLKYTALRYANVYGPRQDAKGEGGVVAIFLDKLLAGQRPIVFGSGEQTRDFIYVQDIVAANLKALNGGDGQILNVSCGQQTRVMDLFDMLQELTGTGIEPVYAPSRQGDILHSYLENSLAREFLGWSPEFSLREGLLRTINYYRR